MLSYQVVEWGKPLERRETPTPTPKGTEVLLSVAACGVCHSDLHIRAGFFDLGQGKKIDLAGLGVALPHTLGHEVVGEVVAVGPEASGVKVGDKRVVYPWIGCGACEFCRRGDELLCPRMQSIGARTHGGYADHVLVPHPRYLIAYGDLSPEQACVYACSGLTAYSALKKLRHVPASETVVLIGAGGVGLNGVLLAPHVLKAKVVVADIDAARRAAALECGAVAAIDNGAADALADVRDMTGSFGASGAVDFVGAPATVAFGIDAMRKAATLVIVGLFGGALPISLPLFPHRQLTITGSYVGTLADMRELMELVLGGKVKPLPVQPKPLAEVNQVLTDMEAGRITGRVVVRP